MSNKVIPILPAFLLTVDVEDWFQVENFKEVIPSSAWNGLPPRIEDNISRLLDVIDDIAQSISQPIRATFFVLGWIAERFPACVRQIANRGHEIASHGYWHQMNTLLSWEDLSTDLARSKTALEDALGVPVYGYRAPTFSVNAQILGQINACGFCYDSSLNRAAVFRRQSPLHLPAALKSSIAVEVSEGFYEVPISDLKIGGRRLPWGGGGYFRLIPNRLFTWGANRIMAEDSAYMFYMHPWEIDPDQPRVREAKPMYRFRHYHNLHRTEDKLRYMLTHLKPCRFMTCRGYLEEMVHGSRFTVHGLKDFEVIERGGS